MKSPSGVSSAELRPSKMQARVWNEFARKFGYDDVAAKFLARIKAQEVWSTELTS